MRSGRAIGRSAGRAPPRAVAQPRGQLGDGRGLEQGADGELDAERRADAADQPRREQRVAAEVEEVVVDADLGRGRESRRTGREDLLLRRARRRGSLRGAKSGAGSALRSSLPFGVSGSASSTTIAAGTM